MDKHIHIHAPAGAVINLVIGETNDVITQLINLKFQQMNDNLAKLEAEVKETTDLQQSAITLLQGLSQQIKDAGTDKVKLDEITNGLDSKNAEFAAAIAANTPAENTGNEGGENAGV